MSTRRGEARVFLNLRRTLKKYRNLQACERLSFYRNIGRSPLGITPQGSSSAGGDVSKYTEK